jgi:hypothetical protein
VLFTHQNPKPPDWRFAPNNSLEINPQKSQTASSGAFADLAYPANHPLSASSRLPPGV